MQIKDLPSSGALASTDVLAKDASGGTTEKINGSDLASSIKTLGSLLGTSDVVNNLTSTATDKPLSAAQGKALYDYMEAKISRNAIASGVHSFTLKNPGILMTLWASSTATIHAVNGTTATLLSGSVPSGGSVTCTADTVTITNPYTWGVIAYGIGNK